MNFSLNDEQAALVDMVQQFARVEMAPFAKAWDEEHIFPIDTIRKAAHQGLGAIYTSPEYGGSGLSRFEAALIFEQLSQACVSTTAFLSIHNMVAWIIDHYGSPDLKARYLPKLAGMDLLASYCLTEPNAGSDAASLTTTAILDNDHYVLNGAKAFISGAGRSDVYAVMVRTGSMGAKGISCILVDKNTPGLSFGKQEQKLGWHSQPTAMVFFENCRVPAHHLVGQEGQGFNIALSGLNGGRVNIAACSLGGAAACLQASLDYVQQRQQFGQPLANFQHTQFTLATMATRLEAAKLMVYRAASAIDSQDPNLVSHCAMAKKFATDECFDIVNQALQLHGGYGYLKDYPIERFFRDLRVHQILEGTNEIMLTIIAKRLLKP